MQEQYLDFEKRKKDHIALALLKDNQADSNSLDYISFNHEALPDLNFNDIQIHSTRFGLRIPNPFFISSMTAGHQNALLINSNLMEACSLSCWAMGVGSQRRELTDLNAASEWQILRKQFPTMALWSNLGIAQLITTPLQSIQKLIDNLQAQAIIIHCNPLQEVIQPEGTPFFKGAWEALEKLIKNLSIPVVVKETGCGFAVSTLKRLNEMGVAAVELSGFGGTHWGRIEGKRASSESMQQKASVVFANWGISTLQSIKNAQEIKPQFEIWGSGGVRHGLDAAKLLALGASSVGFAKVMLESALKDPQSVYDCMSAIEYELKVAMFCTGSSSINDLKEKLCL